MAKPVTRGTTRDHAPLTVEVLEPAPAVALIRVAGSLDADGAVNLGRAVTEELDGCPGRPSPYRLLLDLSEVDLLGPKGLDLLLHLHRRCRVADTHLMLVGTGHRAVHRPLLVSGLLPLFDTRPTPGSAIGRGPDGADEPSGPTALRD